MIRPARGDRTPPGGETELSWIRAWLAAGPSAIELASSERISLVVAKQTTTKWGYAAFTRERNSVFHKFNVGGVQNSQLSSSLLTSYVWSAKWPDCYPTIAL